MDINYRQAEISDIPALVAMRKRFLEELSNEAYAELAYDKELCDYFKRDMPEERVIVLIAEHQDKIIATSAMVIWKCPIGFAGIGKNGKGYILNMFTDKAYRKKGIGRTLLNKLIGKAKDLNLELLHLHATEAGAPLYKSKGFIAPHYEELVLKI